MTVTTDAPVLLLLLLLRVLMAGYNQLTCAATCWTGALTGGCQENYSKYVLFFMFYRIQNNN